MKPMQISAMLNNDALSSEDGAFAPPEARSALVNLTKVVVCILDTSKLRIKGCL